MNIPEEFGKYLLLKKLSEDPLGETFRAGKAGNEGIEQVILLRVFNGKGLDGERLWQRVSGRGGVQTVLRSPNIGTGVDLGRVRSFPYAAYDYISGKSLAAVFARAARQFQPVPADHALLIAERLSLALAAAHETRVQDERVLHGFVVPHLVMISNEGETRLLGFEVAPGLRELAAGGWRDEGVTTYLSPEALAGAPLAKADDIYSLAAILFELLTGERLPAGQEAQTAAIDGATLPNEGTPLPAPVAALLKKSLVPRDQRIADAVTWHKTLSKLMIDGQYSPTTFNLAFFMHNLFREEIERETQEILAEKKLELPPPRPVAVPVPVAAPTVDPREATGVRDGTLSGTRSGVAREAAPSKKGLWIGLAAAALIALAAGGWFLYGRQAAPPPAQVAEATPAPLSQSDPLAGAPLQAAPAGPTPEELQAQIQSMFEARSKEMEAKLKTQYDDRIKLLQQQLEDSKKSGAEPRTERPAVVPDPVPAPAATRAEPPAPAPQQAAAPSTQPAQTPAGSALQPKEDKPAAVEKIASASGPAPTTAAPAPAPAPVRQQPQVQFGDLVQGGAGVVAPKLASRLEPRYPPSAQRLNRSAQVDIKVLVDERGKVMDAERIGTKAGFGFDESAMDAARRATFQPATKEGVRVKMWTTLRVAFKPQ